MVLGGNSLYLALILLTAWLALLGRTLWKLAASPRSRPDTRNSLTLVGTGIATCLVTGLWWFSLSMEAAISMGAAPIARHPTKYFIPEGYVGWVKINHGEKADPLQLSNGKYICRIPASGVLDTSSNVEGGWAKDEYLYYSSADVLRELPETGWGKGGMIWANHSEFQATDRKSVV